ncbi:hypothetical protein Peur_063218 [Populus x canadensis]
MPHDLSSTSQYASCLAKNLKTTKAYWVVAFRVLTRSLQEPTSFDVLRCALYNEKGKREDGLANLHSPALVNFDRKCKAPPSWQWNGNAGLSNGNQVDSKILQTFQKSFVQLEDILDQNRLLINEMNQNQESKIPDNLTRNVGLIKELNNNIIRAVGLYADLSSNVIRSMEPSSEGESSGVSKSNSKRTKSG